MVCEIYLCCVCCAKSLQLCLTLSDPVDHSPPGSSVHGILQAGILEWVAVPSSGDLPNPGSNHCLLCLLHWHVGSYHLEIQIALTYTLYHIFTGASLLAQRMVKNLPAMQETQVQSLACKDPLEEGMGIHSSILA